MLLTRGICRATSAVFLPAKCSLYKKRGLLAGRTQSSRRPYGSFACSFDEMNCIIIPGYGSNIYIQEYLRRAYSPPFLV
ncbi:hypothetical protein CYMTET_14980 [Cymbomonas tetramitiformis]|uniref:Uncharacterized protein n=1 Tax=Cymbomonas tetramitiformis TaxID=36881 RepID=A0AAE0GFF8_9CHLO|nr:hypothetical protein CYMTET_14980 [Cymbomonas tetramitiformis]